MESLLYFAVPMSCTKVMCWLKHSEGYARERDEDTVVLARSINEAHCETVRVWIAVAGAASVLRTNPRGYGRCMGGDPNGRSTKRAARPFGSGLPSQPATSIGLVSALPSYGAIPFRGDSCYGPFLPRSLDDQCSVRVLRVSTAGVPGIPNQYYAGLPCTLAGQFRVSVSPRLLTPGF